MAGIKIKTIKAASLLEVLVAIFILVTVFVIGTLVFIQVSSSSYNGQRLKAALLADKEMKETRESKSFFDEEINQGNLIVKKSVTQYQKKNNLLTIWIQIFDKGQKKLYERKEIVLIDETEN
jgi:Tfp pilus assembly protein PilV